MVLPSNVELTNGQFNKNNLNDVYSFCYLLPLSACIWGEIFELYLTPTEDKVRLSIHFKGRRTCLLVILAKPRDFPVSCGVPVILDCSKRLFKRYKMLEDF